MLYLQKLNHVAAAINASVARSAVGRYFHLEGSGHPNQIRGTRFTIELRAGLTTFFTMAYIIAVNASILTDSGGTCVCNDTADPTCSKDQAYNTCLLEINRDFITATAAIAAFGSCLMGFAANLPVALAPAMSLNAYLTYEIVGYHGTGPISYRVAMTAVFVEGFIFVALSLSGLRQWLARIIPASIKVACGTGIGLFLTLIGLSYSAGIGAVTGSKVTPLALGGCPPQYRDSESGACLSHKATSPTMWIGFLVGGVLTALLMTYKIRGAIIIGIIVVSILSWPRDTAFTYFPRDPVGDSRFEFFKKVIAFRPIKHTFAVQDWNVAKFGGRFALTVFTMLYVDLLDATGTLYSMARFSGVVDPNTGDFPRSTVAYCSDAFSITIGSLFGTSPVTAFIESGAGIQEGGRTGITAITTGFLFFISLFFAPIFASIPPWATGGTLILVGCMMLRGVLAINWNYPGDAIPAFVTLIFMPFSFSIAYGLIAGIMCYAIINSITGLLAWISRNRIVPPDHDNKEYWSIRADDPRGQPWFIRVVKGDKHFWEPDNTVAIELPNDDASVKV